jgi:hypothetical protein
MHVTKIGMTALTIAAITGCHAPRRGACVVIPGVSPRDGAGLARTYQTLHHPLVLTADAVLDCQCYPREHGGAGEGRAFGGNDEARSMGGGDEGRSMGGGDEARSMGGSDEARSMGGGDEARSMGGGDEARSMGGGDEARSMGGGDEGRALGGAGESREHGGSNNRIMCVENHACDGYRLTGESDLHFFDGRAVGDMPDRCLPMALGPSIRLEIAPRAVATMRVPIRLDVWWM